MLVGRELGLGRVGKLLDAVRAGAGGTLVLRGEPGIGKSALIDAGVAAAPDLAVVKTRGRESEAVLPYAALAQLLRPLLPLLAELPPNQARALRRALALAVGAAPGPLAVYAATLALLTASAEQAPVVVVVDDAHLLDQASADAVSFVARRLDYDAIALLVGTRPSAEN